ncbi:MAG: HD domain-containing protein [Nanoarchaeota archaeon]|nr:HD domain-containing protein [Nanoarchaeota archaeon]MBU4300017.1 HD domain-containing protein [Nanoarchaeota archaeon]MBU4451179.1 HD domain-containing protein [Nanoarchaeota archaeon]MCG2724322.1 HD domain-containing protein [archaeon]
MEQKFQKIKEAVEKELSCSAHSMDHIMRVYNLCLHLAENESVDSDVLKAAALLHDIARVKEDNDSSGNTDHAVLSSAMAIPILRDVGFPIDKIRHIQNCIISHRYRTGSEPQTKEAQILFDADKLDILGSTGIARSFMIAGQYGEKIYSDTPVEDYVKDNLVGGKMNGRIKEMLKHAPNLEFETKIRHIPDKLYTKKAKEIGRQRLEFMTGFFERLKKEINGKL